MSDVWEQLLVTGELTPDGIEMLYRTVWGVAVTHRFPNADGSVDWRDRSHVEEAAHDFLGGSQGLQRLVDLAVRSTSEASFKRQLEQSILNYFRTIGRDSRLGKLIARLNRLLGGLEDFERTLHGSWHLVDAPASASTVPFSVLAASVSSASVTVPSWNSESRDAPIAPREELVAMTRTLLQVANGALPTAEIARVIATRIDIRRSGYAVELDTLLGSGAEAAAAELPPERIATTTAEVVRLFDSMSDRERLIAANLEMTVRELADLVGLRHSQTAVVRQRFVDRLRDELGSEFGTEEDGMGAVLLELCSLCEIWLVDRTGSAGSASK